ncbi:hypothetical protein CALVIDRAFT_526417 [Calocera viscosa TUFC12733]|uniref:Uncharacterized protein n=1 Tax=Calocera viscosa (strain TUFC12733) TaxID=1330018 RepID=A0A167NW97_CALVF|nr:hypothetical protein CALVIDRAFT_526417 [Calocera viscosa TUFC12733]
MDVQAVAHGKRLFIFLDGGRGLLKISLNLQGEIMMLPRHNYDTLITNNRHVKRGSAGLAYQIPPEFFNNTRGGTEKSTMFRPMLSLVGRHTVFTVADSNNMCKFKVFVCTTPGDRLTPDDLLWRTKTEYTAFSNILHGTEYGPALHFDGIDVFTRNLRQWRAAVQSSSGSAKKPIVKFISDNNLCFNGFGEWMANDLCAILSTDPRMPIKYFCGVRNNKAWDGLEAWLRKIANEDYVAKFITDCFPISNNDWKHKACVGLVDFATSKAVTQLPSDPTPIPTHTSNTAMRGRIQVVHTGSPGRPAKSRKSAAALKKEAHAAEVRHDQMLAGVLASPGLSMEESGSIQQSWNQTLGAKPANFDNILLRPKDRVERLLSRGKHGEEDDDLWGIDWEDGYSDWEDSDREYKWWDE